MSIQSQWIANNYFLCPNLEKRVALFVGSVKSTFPFLFGSETSKKREKKLVKAYDFRAKRENHVFTRFFSRFYKFQTQNEWDKLIFTRPQIKKLSEFQKTGHIT